MAQKNLIECIGAYFLVLAIGFSGNPLAIGLMLAVMVYCGGHISGAHYNPAVTFGFLVGRKMGLSQVLGYWVSQIMGAFLAAFTFYLVQHKTFAPQPAAGVSFLQACSMEAICTFALVLVIMSVATAKKLEGNFVYGFAIGLTVTASAYVAGGISGGAFNPAVGMGPILVDIIFGSGSPSHIILYIVGPLLGAAMAAKVFEYLNQS